MELEESGQEPQTSGGTWTPQVESLLEDWRNRVYAAQSAHYGAAGMFRVLNYVVGVPAIIFSSVVGTALFAGLERESPKTVMVVSVEKSWKNGPRPA